MRLPWLSLVFALGIVAAAPWDDDPAYMDDCAGVAPQQGHPDEPLKWSFEAGSSYVFRATFFRADKDAKALKRQPFEEIKVAGRRSVRIGDHRFVFEKVDKAEKLLFVVTNETLCSAKAPAKAYPLGFEQSLLAPFKPDPMEFSSLLHLIGLQKGLDGRENVSSLPPALHAKRFLGCKDGTKNKSSPVLQVEIFTASNVPFADPVLRKDQFLPLLYRIKIGLKSTNKTSMSEAFGFEVDSYASSVEPELEWSLYPPAGVQCPSGEAKPAPIPAFPDEMVADLHASNQKLSLVSRLAYSSHNHLLAFDFLGNVTESVLPFTEHLHEQIPVKHPARVVLDARAGLFYAFLEDGHCLNTTNMDNVTSLTGLLQSLPNKTHKISLRSPSQLLAYFPLQSFVYQGKGRDGNGANLSFYTAVKPANTTSLVQSVSLFVSEADWMQQGKWAKGQGRAIVEIRYYGAKAAELSRVRLTSVSNVSGHAFPFSEASVQPCLRLNDTHSYFQLSLKMGTAKLMEFGEERVRSGLRQWMGQTADVSPLRLDSFSLRPEGKDRTLVSGIIALSHNISKSYVESFKVESSLAKALEKLNKTLGAEMKLDSFEGGVKKVAGEAKSLRLAPLTGGGGVLPGPGEKTKQGYSGAAMGVLAIAMLLIGGVGGFGGAILFWKRNRGIHYQVYE